MRQSSYITIETITYFFVTLSLHFISLQYLQLHLNCVKCNQFNFFYLINVFVYSLFKLCYILLYKHRWDKKFAARKLLLSPPPSPPAIGWVLCLLLHQKGGNYCIGSQFSAQFSQSITSGQGWITLLVHPSFSDLCLWMRGEGWGVSFIQRVRSLNENSCDTWYSCETNDTSLWHLSNRQ